MVIPRYNIGDVVRVIGYDWWFAERGLDSNVGVIVGKDVYHYVIEFDKNGKPITGIICSDESLEFAYVPDFDGVPEFNEVESFI